VAAPEPAIRPATTDDVTDLARLRWHLYTEQGSHDEPYEAYVERFTTFAVDALSRPEWRAWVAEIDGRIVGAMWLQSVQRVPAPGRGAPRPLGYLTNAYVEPAHRSRGVGSRLLRTVTDHCEATDHVLMMAWPADEAYAFYERHGFDRPPDPVVYRFDR
jgi:ribosomal protein S18 acetylase RimI-like enzyme